MSARPAEADQAARSGECQEQTLWGAPRLLPLRTIAIVRWVASTSPKRTCWAEALTPEVSGTRLSSIQLVEQLFGIPKVDCIEPFREPAIDRGKEIAGLPTLALIAP